MSLEVAPTDFGDLAVLTGVGLARAIHVTIDTRSITASRIANVLMDLLVFLDMI